MRYFKIFFIAILYFSINTLVLAEEDSCGDNAGNNIFVIKTPSLPIKEMAACIIPKKRQPTAQEEQHIQDTFANPLPWTIDLTNGKPLQVTLTLNGTEFKLKMAHDCDQTLHIKIQGNPLHWPRSIAEITLAQIEGEGQLSIKTMDSDQSNNQICTYIMKDAWKVAPKPGKQCLE